MIDYSLLFRNTLSDDGHVGHNILHYKEKSGKAFSILDLAAYTRGAEFSRYS